MFFGWLVSDIVLEGEACVESFERENHPVPNLLFARLQ